jgi:type IV fimbrial biogenesis protein FimT
MAERSGSSQGVQHGVSLIELAIALAMVGILAGLVAPAVGQLRARSQLSESARALLSAFHLARSTAASRGQPVSLCATDAAGNCVGGGLAAGGWRVRLEPVTGVPPPPEGLLQTSTQLPSAIRVHANRASVVFWPQPRAGATATFLLCATDGAATPSAVIVSQTGRPRISDRAADGSALRCP